MDSNLPQIRMQAVRLERYCRRVRDGIRKGARDDFIQALADCAETAEIARRLYVLIQQHIANAAPHPPPLQDDPYRYLKEATFECRSREQMTTELYHSRNRSHEPMRELE
jgi:hypothetical protein